MEDLVYLLNMCVGLRGISYPHLTPFVPANTNLLDQRGKLYYI